MNCRIIELAIPLVQLMRPLSHKEEITALLVDTASCVGFLDENSAFESEDQRRVTERYGQGK